MAENIARWVGRVGRIHKHGACGRICRVENARCLCMREGWMMAGAQCNFLPRAGWKTTRTKVGVVQGGFMAGPQCNFLPRAGWGAHTHARRMCEDM